MDLIHPITAAQLADALARWERKNMFLVLDQGTGAERHRDAADWLLSTIRGRPLAAPA